MSNLTQERQKERLKYIDLCSYILGYMNRKLLMNRFEIKQAWATKDFTAYQELSGSQLEYDHALRAYKPKPTFQPFYDHNVTTAIELLASGSQTIICEPTLANRGNNYKIQNVEPVLADIYAVLRGLYLGRKVSIEYISRSSGQTSRTIAPHALISTGSFFYVRAFDYKTNEFRSFKLNRIVSSSIAEAKIEQCANQSNDEDWNQIIELTIVCNDGLQNKEAIEFDYGLINGELKVQIKKALLMYFLSDWNIAPLNYTDLPSTLFPLRLNKVITIN